MLREIIFHQEAVNRVSWAYPPINPGDDSASYADMMDDPSVAYAVGLIKDAILAGEWHVQPGGTGRAELALAEDIRRNLEDIDTGEILHRGLDAIWRGFKAQEISWRYGRGKYWLDEVADLNSDQIAFELDEQMRITHVLSKPYGLEPQKLKRQKVWLHAHNGSRMNPGGESILEPAHRVWTSKNRLQQFWGLSIQRFGMTGLKVTIPANTPPARQTQILNTLYAGRLDGVYLVPEDVTIEQLNPTAWANLTFEKAIDYQDQEILKAILYFSSVGTATGSTHVTGTALKEQNRATTFRIQRLSRALARSFTLDVIEPLCAANYGAHRQQCPRLILGQADAERIAALAAPLSQLVGAGIVDAPVAADHLGLPEPGA